MVMNAHTSSGEPIFPGTQYTRVLNATGSNITDIEEQFNATDIIEGWSATPYSGIPIFGDIFFVTIDFGRKMRFLFDGFAMMLDWVATFIPATGGQVVFNWLADALRAIFILMIGTLIFEMASGRKLLP
jgi:hypothetical protein